MKLSTVNEIAGVLVTAGHSNLAMRILGSLSDQTDMDLTDQIASYYNVLNNWNSKGSRKTIQHMMDKLIIEAKKREIKKFPKFI